MANIGYKKMSELEKEIKEILKDYNKNNIEELTEYNWDCISSFYILSEEFIEKYRYYVNWYYLFISQELSKKFKKKWSDVINSSFCYRTHFSEKFIERIEKYQIKKREKEKEEFKEKKLLFNNKYKLLKIY